MTTFVINWVDPASDAVSVTFNDQPDCPWSVPVNRQDPDSWPQTITDWYTAMFAPELPDSSHLIGIPFAVVDDGV